MSSLEETLKKTKAKSEQIKFTRKPVNIANEDRPYSSPSNIDTPQKSALPSPLSVVQNPESESKATATPETKTKSAVEVEIKVAENRQQSGNKPATELETNRQQTDNKVATNLQQPVNKQVYENRNRQQSGNRTGNKTGNKLATNWQQTENKVATKIMFSELVGLQRDIVDFICHECKNSRSRITEPLTLEHISTSLKRSTGAIKTTIQRLEKKGCLTRVRFKNGRGGWSQYEVPDHIYHDAMRIETGNKVETNRQQTGNKVASQLATEPATSVSSSSSSLSLKETTTTTELSSEWNFDIRPYARISFTNSQIKQLASLGTISAAEVEQSLIEFCHDLDNNTLPRITGTKVNYLMGILRKGHSYVSEGFQNEQEAAISEIARRAAAKRESLLKAKFEAWEAGLSHEERKEVEGKLPTHLMVSHRTYGISSVEVRDWLFNYYSQNIVK